MTVIHSTEPIKVLIPIGDVPGDSRVTKNNGDVVFLVKDNLEIYPYLIKSSGPKCIQISKVPKCSETRFMVCNDNIQITPLETEVVWLTTIHELLKLRS